MSLASFLLWLTARRLRANWRLTLAATFSVLLAVTLMAVAVLYSRVLAEAGIRYAIENNTSGVLLNNQLFLQERPLGHKDYQRLDRIVTGELQQHIGWLHEATYRYGQSEQIPFVYNPGDTLPTQDIPLAYLFYKEDFRDHAELLEGRWPAEPSVEDDVVSLEAVLGRAVADFLDWPVGKTIYLVPFRDAQQDQVAVTVVGVAEPATRADEYWYSDFSEFRINFESTEEEADFVVPAYVGESNFFRGMAAEYPMLLAEYRWYTFLDYESLNARTGPEARDALLALESDVNKRLPRALAFTALGNLVDEYDQNLSLARVLLFVFVAMVVGVVIYSLLVVTGLLARDRGAEAAVLRSRGASVWQAGALLGIGEGLVIVSPAMLAGPFLALLISQFLPAGNLDAGGVQVGLSPSVFVAAVGTGVVCVVAFIAMGLGTARQGIVQFLSQHGRESGGSAAYRLALDLVVLAVGGLLWWQVASRGGFITRGSLEPFVSVDSAVLLGPLVILAASGLIVLRLTPWVLIPAARLANPFSTPWLAHALNRMSREPGVYGSLVVLLMLATALGVFGAMFGATLSKGQGDQIRYELGGELVVPTRSVPPEVTESRASMPVYRGRFASRGKDTSSVASFTLLAIDPSTFPSVGWYRDDFAGKPLNDLLRPLRRPPPLGQGVPIPDDAQALGVWLRMGTTTATYDARFLIQDSRGHYLHLPLGVVKGNGRWTYFETDLPQGDPWGFPLRLAAVFLGGQRFSPYGKGEIAIDSVTAVLTHEMVEIEGFETSGGWEPVPDVGTAEDTLTLTADAALSGERGALLTWAHPIGVATRGLFFAPVPLPIPAVGSPRFHKGQELVGTVEDQTVPISVTDAVPYFSTLYSERGPFLIVSMEHLSTYFRAVGSTRGLSFTEVWVGVEEGADRSATVRVLEENLPFGQNVMNREALAKRAEDDPLEGGAWAPVALLGAVAVGGVAILGFALYGGIAVSRSRLELGVLRAVGFTRRQTGLLLALEGFVVGLLGIGLGVALGAWVGRWTLGSLSTTAGGRPLVPPLDITTNEVLVTTSLSLIVLASMASVLVTLVLASRQRLYEVLRLEE